MKTVLRFVDEKSDKFWCVETADCEMVVNYGKTGKTGRYEIIDGITRLAQKKSSGKCL